MISVGRCIHGAAIGLVAMSFVVAAGNGSAVLASSGASSAAMRLRFGPGLFNHPIGVVPSDLVNIPSNWPVDIDGSITCLTCHRQHPSLNNVGNSNPMLRGGDVSGNPSAFCARCHTDRDTQSAAGMHWLAAGSAHIYSDKDTRYLGAGLDQGSRRCLGCHDGVNATDAGTSGRTYGTARYWDKRRNHPVGVPYPRSGFPDSGSSYTPAALVPDHVRLPNGQVGCVSCHDLYAQRDDLLTMSNKGSALCLTCHDMQ